MLQSNKTSSGMTLLEVAVASSILGVVILLSMGFVVQIQGTIKTASIKGDTQASAQLVMDRVTKLLEKTNRRDFDPSMIENRWAIPPATLNPHYSIFVFTPLTVNASQQVIVGPTTMALKVEDDPADPHDGADNNGNGITDEKTLTLHFDYNAATKQGTTKTKLAGNIELQQTGDGISYWPVFESMGYFNSTQNYAVKIRLTFAKKDPANSSIVRTSVENTIFSVTYK